MLSQEQIQQLYLWWRLFQDDGKDLCEIRCLDGHDTYSGYYRNIENIIRDVDKISALPNMQVYFVMNSIHEGCYDRQQHETLIKRPKNTTSDNDIVGRKYILIDFDPKRPSGVGSTAEELEYAHQKALQVYRFLKQQGLTQPIVTQSGNGWHLYEKVRLANTPENTKLVERFLKALSMMFSDDRVEVDCAVYNLARVTKLVSTYAKKGANTEERPWRMSKIVKYPDEVLPNNREYIEKIANLYPEENPRPTKENGFGREKFDIVAFLAKHNIEYRVVRTSLGTRYLLKHCPFDNSHAHGDAMIFQRENGALAFSCFHASCQQYTWSDFRLFYEPDAYNKKDYQEFQHKQRYYSQYAPVPVEIKDENKEDGKKWLSFRDIKRVRDEELIAVPTGIYVLDKAIKGLILGETSILSGINASGKTSFINTLLLNAVQKGFPSALWSGELQASRLQGWIAQSAAGKAHVTKVVGSDFAYEANDNVMPKIADWLDDKLLIYNNNYGSKWKQLLSDIKECITQHNVKFIVLDNLMALSLEEIAGDKNEKQKQLILELSELAKQTNVHILMVAHPRKEAGNTLLRKESISGTSDLTNVIHNLFLIHRVGNDFEKRATEFWGKEKTTELCTYDNVIEVAKNRAYGVTDFVVGLYYERETRRYKNTVSEYVHYGWEPDNGYQQYTAPTTLQYVETPLVPTNTTFDTTPTPTNSIKVDNNTVYELQFDGEEAPF